MNLLSIILFMKNSNLQTRGMYLVINLTVADMLVGGFSMIGLLLFLGTGCDSETVGWVLCHLSPLLSASA